MKKIRISKKSTIYILAPSQQSTGGPECLHQLGYYLKKMFRLQNIKMVYLPLNDSEPIHKDYKHYKLKFSNHIVDNENNILIMPEKYEMLKFSLNFKKITKIIWWLSLDNYFAFKFNAEYSKISRSFIKIPLKLISVFNRITSYRFGFFTYHDYLKAFYKMFDIKKQKEVSQASFHLSQSLYAYNFLKKKLRNVEMLYDYQSPKKLKNINYKITKKSNLICYSHKSNIFINLIKSQCNAKFIELKNFSSKDIVKIFKKSKIYIDFGYHPGKDRMPREAVLFDNCIISNLKGSAKNDNDIPISKEFKFNEKYSNIKNILKKIEKIFSSHRSELKKFKKYKKIVLSEEKKFKTQILKIFIKN